jgi:hypothetical protein
MLSHADLVHMLGCTHMLKPRCRTVRTPIDTMRLNRRASLDGEDRDTPVRPVESDRN